MLKLAKPEEKPEIHILRERPRTITQPDGTVETIWVVTYRVGDGRILQVHVPDAEHENEKLRRFLLEHHAAEEKFKPRVL